MENTPILNKILANQVKKYMKKDKTKWDLSLECKVGSTMKSIIGSISVIHHINRIRDKNT